MSEELLRHGNRLGRYLLRELIGQGGMGKVYRAWDEVLHRDVAVKVLTTLDDDMLRRFAREAAAIGRLENHHVVEIHDLCADGPHPYIVMEYLRGECLQDRLRRGPLSVEEKENGELIQAILMADYPTLREQRPDVPVAVEQVVSRAMAAHRAARFPSVLELARALVPHASAPGRVLWKQVFESSDELPLAGKNAELSGSMTKVESPSHGLETTLVVRAEEVAALANRCRAKHCRGWHRGVDPTGTGCLRDFRFRVHRPTPGGRRCGRRPRRRCDGVPLPGQACGGRRQRIWSDGERPVLEIIRRFAQRTETADIEPTCAVAPRNQREVLLDVAAGPDEGLAVRRENMSRRFAP